MRLVAWIIAWGSLLFLIPAQAQLQAQQVAAKGPKSGGFAMETGEACSGISTAECCEQKIEMAGLRTQGDYLPRLIKTTVRLACGDEARVVTPQVCRSIAIGRGFDPHQADAVCKPAAKDCKKDGACRECVQELNRLDYQGSANACHPVTFVPDRSGTKKVVLHVDGADSDTRFEVLRKRTQIN
jgi:hypothetical protein